MTSAYAGLASSVRCPAKPPGERPRLLQSVDDRPLFRSLPVERLLPVDETPPLPVVPEHAVRTDAVQHEFRLQDAQRPEIACGLFVAARLEVLQDRRRIDGCVVKDTARAAARRGPLVRVAVDKAVPPARSRQKVQRALHDLEIAIGLVVRKGLEPEIAEPEPAVALRAILKHRLHAIAERTPSRCVDLRRLVR